VPICYVTVFQVLDALLLPSPLSTLLSLVWTGDKKVQALIEAQASHAGKGMRVAANINVAMNVLLAVIEKADAEQLELVRSAFGRAQDVMTVLFLLSFLKNCLAFIVWSVYSHVEDKLTFSGVEREKSQSKKKKKHAQ
jgi:hypothetical protein